MTRVSTLKIGGYFGATLGFLGWLLGFAFACLSTGETDSFREVVLPGLALSLTLAAVFIVTLEGIARIYGTGHAAYLVGLWGLLLFDMGLMVIIINHWLAPIIDKSSALLRFLQQYDSVYRLPDLIPITLIAGGLTLLMVLTIVCARCTPYLRRQRRR